MASTRLTFTQGTPTDGTAWTYSGWIKIADGTGTNSYALITSYQGTNNDRIQIDGSRRIHVEFKDGASTVYEQHPTAKLRDTNGWYHVVVAFDSSEAQADRVKIYLNGTRLTDMDIDTQLTDGTYTTKGFNASGKVMDVGTYNAAGSYLNFFDGSMAHVHFTDGTAYAASTFGETDSTTGIWKPITSPSVTYGNNGWFLKFANSGSMGTDSSGNSNNFSVAAGTLTQTQDTPSNVFATINSNWRTFNGNPAFSNLNLTISPTTTAYQNHFSTLGVQGSGKWYAEMKCNGSSNSAMYYGISSEADLDYLTNNSNVGGHTGTNSYMIAMSSGDKRTNGTNSSYGSGFANGDIMMFALDLDNSKVYFGKNGTWFNSGDPAAGTNPAFSDVLTNSFYFFGGTAYTNGFTSVDYNFGNGYFGTTAVSSANSDGAGYGLFEYAPPTGYYSLCTKNINTYG